MVRHPIYCQNFMIIILNYPCNVFVEIIFSFWTNYTLPVLNSENRLNVNLRISSP